MVPLPLNNMNQLTKHPLNYSKLHRRNELIIIVCLCTQHRADSIESFLYAILRFSTLVVWDEFCQLIIGEPLTNTQTSAIIIVDLINVLAINHSVVLNASHPILQQPTKFKYNGHVEWIVWVFRTSFLLTHTLRQLHTGSSHHHTTSSYYVVFSFPFHLFQYATFFYLHFLAFFRVCFFFSSFILKFHLIYSVN